MCFSKINNCKCCRKRILREQEVIHHCEHFNENLVESQIFKNLAFQKEFINNKPFYFSILNNKKVCRAIVLQTNYDFFCLSCVVKNCSATQNHDPHRCFRIIANVPSANCPRFCGCEFCLTFSVEGFLEFW